MHPHEHFWYATPTGYAKASYKMWLNSMYGKESQQMELKGKNMFPIHGARRVQTTDDGTTIVGPDRLTIISDIRNQVGETVGYLAVKESDPINGPVERMDGDTVNVMFIERYTVIFS